MKLIWAPSLLAILVAACTPANTPTDEAAAPDQAEDAAIASVESEAGPSNTDADAIGALLAGAQLVDILADPRRDADRARDEWRHPMETVSFFGLTPDMTVAEVLPGGGWYTRVLLPYVADQGRFVALSYPLSVWEPMFGDSWTEERAAQYAGYPETAPEQVAAFGPETAEPITAYLLGSIPDDQNGQADAVLFIRALHHLNRFDPAILQTALADTYDFLRPGGIVGVVQHRAPADETDERANGDRGYMREADVIAAFEQAGFVLDEASEINANPADTADYDVGVWMLPPTNGGDSEEEDVPPLQSVGETDRMTLRFHKPE